MSGQRNNQHRKPQSKPNNSSGGGNKKGSSFIPTLKEAKLIGFGFIIFIFGNFIFQDAGGEFEMFDDYTSYGNHQTTGINKDGYKPPKIIPKPSHNPYKDVTEDLEKERKRLVKVYKEAMR